ncbi:SWIM-type domain-containing protein [Mycena sanguinolenta]|uniref:SWIM-type domain-containing protein n=1 Tax=Mycena sanguinolenta TaxID=230812 RepID=A0A8H7CB85_9AGAR|nr:SWIM-type domain-containing protein [Mycena sanguinolenta]
MILADPDPKHLLPGLTFVVSHVTRHKSKNNNREKKQKTQNSNHSTQEIRFHRVTEEVDGALTCNCPEYRGTGKACVEILAVRTLLEFGPPKAYFAEPKDDPEAPKGKKRVQFSRKAARGSGKRGQRPLADRQVQKDHDKLLERLDDGWTAFDSDEDGDFTDSDDEGQPAKKKSKSRHVKPATQSRVSPGRPPASTPLHPGRSSKSPTKFSSKPGPKGRGKNSLLPSLDPLSKMSLLQSKGDSDHSSVDEPAFSAEDLGIVNLNWKDWDAADYMLRQDQAIEMANILEALCLARNPSILVLPPTFDRETELLRDIDWLPSDTEPIDHTGAPAFPHESVLKNAWLHSQSATLKKILAFQHDPERNHWLLFEVNLATERMICYEPLSHHRAKDIHMAGLALIAKFLKPGRSDGAKPGVHDECKYFARLLKIQTDGASCGFWMATLAFLSIYEIPLNGTVLTTLQELGPKQIKEYWKCIITSWRVEEEGLGREPANDFLHCFGYHLQEEPQCIARRPEWIRRFNPEAFEQEMNQPMRDVNYFLMIQFANIGLSYLY